MEALVTGVFFQTQQYARMVQIMEFFVLVSIKILHNTPFSDPLSALNQIEWQIN